MDSDQQRHGGCLLTLALVMYMNATHALTIEPSLQVACQFESCPTLNLVLLPLQDVRNREKKG